MCADKLFSMISSGYINLINSDPGLAVRLLLNHGDGLKSKDMITVHTVRLRHASLSIYMCKHCVIASFCRLKYSCVVVTTLTFPMTFINA